jgi:hypothetical protein
MAQLALRSFTFYRAPAEDSKQYSGPNIERFLNYGTRSSRGVATNTPQCHGDERLAYICDQLHPVYFSPLRVTANLAE